MTTKRTTSHELADGLRALADKLTSKPAVALPYCESTIRLYYSDKEQFLDAAKAFGGNKETGDSYYTLLSTYGPLMVAVYTDRDMVCRLVTPATPAVYECETLFTPEEEAAIGTGQ
jgi:hypothetical protein